jgi:predicted O-methyltransferase YrrM
MTTITNWTPKYILNRVALSFYERLNPDYPWLTSDSIKILNSLLKKSDIGLEWGSGRSTAWIASRIKHLTSVESNQKWFEIVKSKLNEETLDNVSYIFSDDPSSYVEVVDRFSDTSLDFILVDGDVDGHSTSVRGRCALAAVTKLKLGGCIVIDNANWFLPSQSSSPNSRTDDAYSSEWTEFLSRVESWRVIWTTNGVSDTAIFIKSL